LLTEANAAFATDTPDLLLTALSLALSQSLRCPAVLIALEGHGREEITPPTDVSRTVGWFTSLFPLLLRLPELPLPAQVKHLKEHLRRVPHKGLGYGLLRYLGTPTQRQALACQPSLCFNYLGQFDALDRPDGATLPDPGALQLASEPAGDSVSPDRPREYPLEVTALVTGGQLQVNIRYWPVHYGQATMAAFAGDYRDALLQVLDCCLNRSQRPQLTPSDLGYKHLSFEDLEDITRLFD
jgi:non-ribosomal peptide synthase protein (TIGR01720 family)